MILAGPALGAGFVLTGVARADEHIVLSPLVTSLTAGLFCAPEDGDRRPAPDTMAGWIHVPDTPVEMVAEGQIAPALLGTGFGVRFTLAGTQAARMRYTVTHPPMPPSGMTAQSWETDVVAGFVDSAFFQFDYAHELQPGDWSFRASIGDQQIFDVGFTVRPAAQVPSLVGLCQGGAYLSLNQRSRAAAG